MSKMDAYLALRFYSKCLLGWAIFMAVTIALEFLMRVL